MICHLTRVLTVQSILHRVVYGSGRGSKNSTLHFVYNTWF